MAVVRRPPPASHLHLRTGPSRGNLLASSRGTTTATTPTPLPGSTRLTRALTRTLALPHTPTHSLP